MCSIVYTVYAVVYGCAVQVYDELKNTDPLPPISGSTGPSLHALPLCLCNTLYIDWVTPVRSMVCVILTVPSVRSQGSIN